MKQIYIHFSVIILASLTVFGKQAIAQRDTTKLNQNVEVVKPYRPSISNVQKLNLLPVIQDTAHFTPEFNYSIDSYPFNTRFNAYPIGAAEIKNQAYNNNGIGYLKLGAGTYNTTYGDFFLGIPKSKYWTFGLRLKHLASQGNAKLTKGDISDASYSNNKAEVFGSGLLGSSTLSSGLSYTRDMVKFYGYPDTIPVVLNSPNIYAPYFGTKQILQKTQFDIKLKSNEEEKSIFNYNTRFRFHYFDTQTGQQENAMGLFADFGYGFEKFKGLVESSFDHFTTKGILLSPDQERKDSWLKLAPALLFSGDSWSLKAGVQFYSVFTGPGENTARLYPKFDFTYIPVKDILTLYAGLDGYLQNCNYSEIAYENNWVDPMHNVINADHRYIFSGGLKGKINQQISYNISAKYSDVKDMHFYILKSANTAPPYIYNNAFDLLYDNTGIFNLSMEFSYVLGKDYSFKLKGNFYDYNMESLGFAPLLPDFDLFGTAVYRINERLNGFTDIMVTGQRKALFQSADETSKAYELDPILKINLGAEYELKHNLKIFGRIDNLLNQNYEQLPGYNSLGLRLMAGASISF
jgi:hypothetical protein